MEVTIIVILLGFIIALSARMLFREFEHVTRRMADFEEKSLQKSVAIQALEERMHILEQANRLRMPHKAQDNVLDVIAIVSEVLENTQDLNLLEKQRRQREERDLEGAVIRLKEALSIGTNREEK